MKAVVAAFNQEKALVGAFSVIVQKVVEPKDRYTALLSSLFPPLTVTVSSRRQTSKASAGSLLHAWDVVIKFYEMKASLTSCCRSYC